MKITIYCLNSGSCVPCAHFSIFKGVAWENVSEKYFFQFRIYKKLLSASRAPVVWRVNSEGNEKTNALVEFASSFFSPPCLSKTEGKLKTPFVSAHFIWAVMVQRESPVCGAFQQNMVPGLVIWTRLCSPWRLIIITDWELLGQNATILKYIKNVNTEHSVYAFNRYYN